MEVVAIVNRKGGVGKTATVLALGAGLQKAGYKVLFIDLDSQCNLTQGIDANQEQLNSMDILTGNAKAVDSIQHTLQGEVIAGTETLAGADAIIDGTGKEYRLKEAITGLKYDYVIIDTPAQLGTLTINALTASNSIIIPVQADIDSLQGIVQLNKAITAVKKYCNKALKIKGILITRFNGRAVISKDMQSNFDNIAKELKTKLYKTTIRECIAIKEAKASKRSIFDYAPRSNATKDYNSFLKEFLGN